MLKIREKNKFINNGYLDLPNIFEDKYIRKFQKKLKAIIPKETKIFYKDFATFKKKQDLQKLRPG